MATHGKSQTLTSTISAVGLAEGSYHAVVRADNVEPVSGTPLSALYYDVDVEVIAPAATIGLLGRLAATSDPGPTHR